MRFSKRTTVGIMILIVASIFFSTYIIDNKNKEKFFDLPSYFDKNKIETLSSQAITLFTSGNYNDLKELGDENFKKTFSDMNSKKVIKKIKGYGKMKNFTIKKIVGFSEKNERKNKDRVFANCLMQVTFEKANKEMQLFFNNNYKLVMIYLN